MPPAGKRVLLHAGTHKTGTTALQVFCAGNTVQLAQAGIHYPLAGRHHEPPFVSAGHHAVAGDLLRKFGSATGSRGANLAAVLSEIEHVQAKTVILSSEEFLPLLEFPGALDTLNARLREIGYLTLPVVMLRAQPDYLESLYAEVVARFPARESFDEVLDAALETGTLVLPGYARTFPLSYGTLIAALESIFGQGKVLPRAYRPDRGSAFVRQDFFGVVGRFHGDFTLGDPYDPMPRVNQRPALLELLSKIACSHGKRLNIMSILKNFPGFDHTDLMGPFSFITRGDRARFLQRFAAENAALNERFGIEIPFVRESNIAMSDAAEARAKSHRALLAAVLDRLCLERAATPA